jgi:hypothetical protein
MFKDCLWPSLEAQLENMRTYNSIWVLELGLRLTLSVFIAVIADEKYYEKISFLFWKYDKVITISGNYYK